MLVNKRMSSPVVTVAPDMRLIDCLRLMQSEKIRRTPVVKDGRLIGIVSDKDLLNASPSKATSLSVWEINYLLSEITIDSVMTRKVLTITEDTPIEEAARIMADNKIGGLPVMHGSQVVGLITETDLFKIFLEFMGGREMGVRVTALVAQKLGTLAELTRAVAECGGSFLAFSQFDGQGPDSKTVTFKVAGLGQEAVQDAIEPLVEAVMDIRTCC
jgi:acetoin utilization protein AcuB